MSQKQRMGRAPAGSKPRVYQQLPVRGAWWADVRDEAGDYHCALHFSYDAALQQAVKYAAGIYE